MARSIQPVKFGSALQRRVVPANTQQVVSPSEPPLLDKLKKLKLRSE